MCPNPTEEPKVFREDTYTRSFHWGVREPPRNNDYQSEGERVTSPRVSLGPRASHLGKAALRLLEGRGRRHRPPAGPGPSAPRRVADPTAATADRGRGEASGAPGPTLDGGKQKSVTPTPTPPNVQGSRTARSGGHGRV